MKKYFGFFSQRELARGLQISQSPRARKASPWATLSAALPGLRHRLPAPEGRRSVAQGEALPSPGEPSGSPILSTRPPRTVAHRRPGSAGAPPWVRGRAVRRCPALARRAVQAAHSQGRHRDAVRPRPQPCRLSRGSRLPSRIGGAVADSAPPPERKSQPALLPDIAGPRWSRRRRRSSARRWIAPSPSLTRRRSAAPRRWSWSRTAASSPSAMRKAMASTRRSSASPRPNR